jgi:superfamily II DNA or RNA helicase
MSNETIADGKNREGAAAAPVQPLPPGVITGNVVFARGREWTVRAVVPRQDCTELHLSRATEPRVRVLLWPFDRAVARLPTRSLRVLKLRRWWSHVAAVSRAARVDGLCARAAGARVLPYQLVPALAVAHGVSRVVLADEVGLGKTVQAGWILSDLLQRQPDARVLVAVPAGLRRQWEGELAAHFAIGVVAADASWLRRTFADLPADVDPWSLPGVYVTSIDFLKRADVLRSMERHTWDVLVVDEAHTAAAPTERHTAIVATACRARRIVLITATPFSGDRAAFTSLMRLGSMQDEPPLMFRRAREDEGGSRPRRHRFAAIRIGRAERQLQRMLERYTRQVWNTTGHEGARLAMTVLRKRALSSPGAVARSLERRRELLARHRPAPQQLPLFEDENTIEDEEPLAALSAPGLADDRREDRWLAQLADAAHAASDSKRRYLVRLLRRLGGEAAIVFTEYRDTLRQLSASFPGCSILHGGMTVADRAHVQARFNEHGGVLLATDAASEGLNLQDRCRLVVSYELPWNPARLEQRIGRVDRIGQSRRVHAITLVARDTAEDLVIARLVRRLARVAATLGERDRLAGFLSEARTAGIVIGGGPEEPLHEPTLPRVTMGPAITKAAIDEASRLSSAATDVVTSRDGLLRIASIRGSAALGPGFLFVFACSAVDGDGRMVDCHPALAYVSVNEVARPVRAADARETASDAIQRYEDRAADAVAPQAATRLSRVHVLHADVIDRAIAREVELRDWSAEVAEVQPGLFDRRDLVEANEASALRQQSRHDHDRRIGDLTRARVLTARCDLIGVLIVHGAHGLSRVPRQGASEDE